MLGKAVALGLQLDAGFVSEYGSPDGLDALDTIHESWSLLWLAPRTRTLPNDAALGNSVGIRCQYDTTYQPVNVKRDDGTLVDSYQIVPVVKPAPA
jgi:hypothetical protein